MRSLAVCTPLTLLSRVTPREPVRLDIDVRAYTHVHTREARVCAVDIGVSEFPTRRGIGLRASTAVEISCRTDTSSRSLHALSNRYGARLGVDCYFTPVLSAQAARRAGPGSLFRGPCSSHGADILSFNARGTLLRAWLSAVTTLGLPLAVTFAMLIGFVPIDRRAKASSAIDRVDSPMRLITVSGRLAYSVKGLLQ